ncbi:hypothetical protein JOM56_003102 [Amanita muscaria]
MTSIICTARVIHHSFFNPDIVKQTNMTSKQGIFRAVGIGSWALAKGLLRVRRSEAQHARISCIEYRIRVASHNYRLHSISSTNPDGRCQVAAHVLFSSLEYHRSSCAYVYYLLTTIYLHAVMPCDNCAIMMFISFIQFIIYPSIFQDCCRLLPPSTAFRYPFLASLLPFGNWTWVLTIVLLCLLRLQWLLQVVCGFLKLLG